MNCRGFIILIAKQFAEESNPRTMGVIKENVNKVHSVKNNKRVGTTV